MKTRIAELDGLRAFAVLGVILFHMTDFSGAIPKIHPYISQCISYFGPAGVYIFFIISGFIITTLLFKEREKTGTVSLKKFYIRRFFRIIPPFFFYTLGLLLLSYTKYITIDSQNFLYSYLFITNLGFLVEPGKEFLAHTWSLSAEEQYYLIFPPILIIIFKFKRKSITWLLIGSFLLSLVSLKIAKILSYTHPTLINIAALYKFKYIIVGVLLAIYRDTVHKITNNTSIIFPIAVPIVLIIIDHINIPYGLNIIASGMEAFAWGLWVMWFVENPKKCGVLRSSIVQWIGKCSYSLYLWQQLFVQPADQYNGWTISTSPLSIIPIFVFACFSYYAIEIPSIKVGRIVSDSTEKKVHRPSYSV